MDVKTREEIKRLIIEVVRGMLAQDLRQHGPLYQLIKREITSLNESRIDIKQR